MTADDNELIRRCGRENDPEALRELVRRHEPPLRGFLTRLLDDPEDVDDVLADVFVRLWRTAGRYRGQCTVASWVYRIAANAATDVLRHRRSARRLFVPFAPGFEAVSHDAGPEQALLNEEREARLTALARAAMDCLKPEERVAVVLHHLEGFSYQEVAEKTGVPLTAVRMRLYRARRRMEARLRDWMEDDEIPHPAAAKADLSPCVRGHRP